LGQSAALYCRVSTADQTCARQERDLRAFAKKAGYKILGVCLYLYRLSGNKLPPIAVTTAKRWPLTWRESRR
jgi:hypothetical protein